MDSTASVPAGGTCDSLTPAQMEAVQHLDGPLLILAGPGSGKTRVVTHRIAYLLGQGVAASEILALTFTNKAADEMRQRLESLARRQPVWMGTFHRFCSRLLRQHAELVGLQENFSIYDTQDSHQALKLAIRDLNLELTHTSPESIAHAISWAKNELITAEHYQPRLGSSMGGVVAQVYPAYQRRLLTANAVDFDDLLLHVATLLRENPELRRMLDERFRYILVDEYQDTNLAQYAIVRALSIDHPNLAVTGDPDQSIYGWRGANLSNILDFEKDYPNVRIVRLEQNYRSTPNILRVADQLIAHNCKRKEKRLYTDRPEGAAVRMAIYPTSRDETDDIARRIASDVHSGRRRLRDIAILYRVNALSRSIENSLRLHQLPYQIINGVEFYQRREIKDILAYLHLLNNPSHDAALLRVINTPPRKIGKKTVERLIEHSRQLRCPLLETARQAGLIATLTGPAAVAVAKFVSLVDRLSVLITRPLEELLKEVLVESGYHDWLAASESDDDQERLANIEELLTDAREFDEQNPEASGLEEFLEQKSLVADTDAWEDEADQVTLMTMHAAKGLEFPVVYIVAVEEGLIPHERSRENSDKLEEERRLLFVGITRAAEELQLSLSQYRTFRGDRRPTISSQFLMELPRAEMQLIEPADFRSDDFEADGPASFPWESDSFEADSNATAPTEAADDVDVHVDGMWDEPAAIPRRYPVNGFRLGMVVDHPDYGSGRIVGLSGAGQKRTATVDFFGDSGQHTFRLAHCPLVPTDLAE